MAPKARIRTVTVRALQALFAVVLLISVCWQLAGRTPILSKRVQVPAPRPAPCAGTCILVSLDNLQPMSRLMYGVNLSPEDLALESYLQGELLYDVNFAAFTWFKTRPHSSGKESAANTAASDTVLSDRDSDAHNKQPLAIEPQLLPGSEGLPKEVTLEQLKQLPVTVHPLHVAKDRPAVSWAVSSNTRVQLLQQLGDPHSLRLQVGAATAELVNAGPGLHGFAVTAGTAYLVRLRWRSVKGDVKQLVVSLVDDAVPASDTTPHTSSVQHSVSPDTEPQDSHHHLQAHILGAGAGSGQQHTHGAGGTGEAQQGRVVLAQVVFRDVQAEGWEVLQDTLTPNMTTRTAKLVVGFKGPGSVDLDWVSLTYATHLNSASPTPTPAQLNPHAVRRLKQLKPQFLRFQSPHPLHVDNTEFDVSVSDGTRLMSWQMGIGSPHVRPGYEHPQAPNLWVDTNLGLAELMMLSAELGAQPVLEVPIPYTHHEQGDTSAGGAGIETTGSHTTSSSSSASDSQPSQISEADREHQAATKLLHNVVQLLEFLHGGVDTRWGKVRTSLGHPKPWNLTYLALTVPDCSALSYGHWFGLFTEALAVQHPHMKLLSSCPWQSLVESVPWDVGLGARVEAERMVQQATSAVDWHAGPPLAVSSLAVLSPTPSVVAAVAEAALMTALERNCGKVVMASHGSVLGLAPPAQSSRATNVTTSHLLTVDLGQGGAVRTPSWHVQHLFSSHRGTHCAQSHVLVDGVDLSARAEERHAMLWGFDDDDLYEEIWEEDLRKTHSEEAGEQDTKVSAVEDYLALGSDGATAATPGSRSDGTSALAGGDGAGSGGRAGATGRSVLSSLTPVQGSRTEGASSGAGLDAGVDDVRTSAVSPSQGQQDAVADTRLSNAVNKGLSGGGGIGGGSGRQAVLDVAMSSASRRLLQEGSRILGHHIRKTPSTPQSQELHVSARRAGLHAWYQHQKNLVATWVQAAWQQLLQLLVVILDTVQNPIDEVIYGSEAEVDLDDYAYQLHSSRAGIPEGPAAAGGGSTPGQEGSGRQWAPGREDPGSLSSVRSPTRRQLLQAKQNGGANAGSSSGSSSGFSSGYQGTEDALKNLDSGQLAAAAQLQSSASCTSHDQYEPGRCAQVAVKVVNYGRMQQDVTVQLFSARARLRPLHRIQQSSGVSGTGRRLLSRILPQRGKRPPAAGGLLGGRPRPGTLIQVSSSDPLMDTNDLLADGRVHVKVEPHSRPIQVSEQTRLSLPPYSLSVLLVDLGTQPAKHTRAAAVGHGHDR